MKKILKTNIVGLLRQSVDGQNVYVPVTSEQGDTLFTLLPKSGNELEEMLQAINLEDSWVIIPPKDIFFPQQEDMFIFDETGVREQLETSKKLIFGIKPCDLKGMLFSDDFFKRDFDDIYYQSRAKDRLIVVIGCLTPPRPESCFCSSAHAGPFADGGFDVQFVDTGDWYAVEIGSQQGQDYVDTYPMFFQDAESIETDKVNAVKLAARENVVLNVDFDKALEMMQDDGTDFTEIYKRIGERCLYCSACLYTCPTCTCFNVFDEMVDNQGVRRRNWDGCVFEGYTRETSGHNPRKEKWVRTARRYEHKLKYDYLVTGESGCVGCGRCLSSCPVNIGMSKFIVEITENRRMM